MVIEAPTPLNDQGLTTSLKYENALARQKIMQLELFLQQKKRENVLLNQQVAVLKNENDDLKQKNNALHAAVEQGAGPYTTLNFRTD